MRITTLFAASLLMSGCLLPMQTSGRVDASVVVAAPSPEVVFFAYSPAMYGEWRVSYMQWTPVTIYYSSGRYYRNHMQGSRSVVVYQRGNDFFMPPRERAWVGVDKRFDQSQRPGRGDHGRAKKHDNRGGK
jgi:hypothetical protein